MRIIEILSATSDQEINVDDPHSLPIRIGDQRGKEINDGLEGAEARGTDTSVRPRGRQEKQMRREQGSGVEQPK